MKIFCDHEELIAELKRQRDSLQAALDAQTKVVQAHQVTIASLQESVAKLAVAMRAQPHPATLTREDMARKLGIPVSAIDLVDWERIGVTTQLEETTKRIR